MKTTREVALAMDLSLDEVISLIVEANQRRDRRARAGAIETSSDTSSEAERLLEENFNASQHLAVYGSLAPGRSNHHVVAPLGGEWTDGCIEGDRVAVGWGAALGFNAFRPRVGGSAVDVKVLSAATLPSAWAELDQFEGEEYQRVLVPVFSRGPRKGRRLQTVANVYAAAATLAD